MDLNEQQLGAQTPIRHKPASGGGSTRGTTLVKSQTIALVSGTTMLLMAAGILTLVPTTTRGLANEHRATNQLVAQTGTSLQAADQMSAASLAANSELNGSPRSADSYDKPTTSGRQELGAGARQHSSELANDSADYSMDDLSALSQNNSKLAQDSAQIQDYQLIKYYGILSSNALIFVVGFIGNSVVILVILKFTRTETVTDIYILNLAMADLMFITGLIFLITTMIIDNWIFGFLVCKLYMSLTSLNQFASSLLLVVMSFDRFIAVCHPIYAQRFRQTRSAKIICACIWVICLVLMSPIFLFAKIHKENDTRITCSISWPDTKVLGFSCEWAFTLYSFAIGFAVPLLLIAGFYTQVIRKLRIAASGPIGLGSTRRSRSREETNRRIEHLVTGIICTYSICWLPYWVTQIIISAVPVSLPDALQEVAMLSSCLSYINSALNPILYAFLSDNFKRRCSDIIHSLYRLNWCRAAGCSAPLSTATTQCYESEVSRAGGGGGGDARLAASVVMSDVSSVTIIKSPMVSERRSSDSRRHSNRKNAAPSPQPKAGAKPTTTTTTTTTTSTTTSTTSKSSPPGAKVRIKHHQVAESQFDDSGQVYCGEQKRSVAFGASTVLVQSRNDSQRPDKCDDV